MRISITVLLTLIWSLTYSQTNDEIKWIKDNSREILPADSDYKEFGFLDSLLINKRIVMLGENTHGSSEYYLLKNRIIHYLHEKLGFNILTGESDELDHLYPEQIDQGIRSKLTTHFRTKLTTLIRAN
jgi:erythromycin esterase-like protein